MITWRALPCLRYGYLDLYFRSPRSHSPGHVKRNPGALSDFPKGLSTKSTGHNRSTVPCRVPKPKGVGFYPITHTHLERRITSHITLPVCPDKAEGPCKIGSFLGREERRSFQTISISGISHVY